MTRLLALSGVIPAILVGLGACGPVTSTMTMNDAIVAVDSAGLEEAGDYAIYEYISAVEYLEKAREEWAYSDYQHAEEYAQRALDFARQAQERARANPDRALRGLEGPDDDDLDF